MKLGSLLGELERRGITLDGDTPVAMSVARDLKICLFPDGAPAVFLRVLARDKGERDLANLRFLQTRLGSHVNGPSNVVQSDDLVCGVFPYLRHRKATHRLLIEQGRLPEVGRILVSMHAAGVQFASTGSTSRTTFDSEQRAPDPDSSNLPFARRVDTCLQEAIAHRAPAAQHCDFTYANLGIGDDGTLIVFDWEEYGFVQFPGFDFATFLLSHHYRAGSIDALLDSPESLVECIERDFGPSVLSGLEFTESQFVRVFPGYLWTFLTLKRQFGTKIHDRIRAMWMRMQASDAWMTALVKDRE